MHRMDPRTKILLAVLYIVGSFLCRGTFAFALLALSALTLILLGKIPIKTVIKGIKGLIFVLLFTVGIKIFFTVGAAEHQLISWWAIHVYWEGIWEGIYILVRIVTMIVVSGLFLSYTTTPIMLTDGIESLLSPLKKLHLHVHEFAMMTSIALRFIPIIMEEAEKITAAQQSRGVDFTSGGLLKRVKAFIPVIIPLFVSSIHRGTELATAMECRCYHGGEGRTKFHVLKFRPTDYVAFGAGIAFIVSIVVLNGIGIGYTM